LIESAITLYDLILSASKINKMSSHHALPTEHGEHDTPAIPNRPAQGVSDSMNCSFKVASYEEIIFMTYNPGNRITNPN
jgi:hypothetical protein